MSSWIAIFLQAWFLATYVGADWDWKIGRATHYGGPGDPWTIHEGSCKYGYLDPNKGTGWDVAALADANPDYPGSCGRCYEVACANLQLTDGYGQRLDRTSICHNTDQSVVISITDECPCHYPTNYYSNKRWCCGDYYHFDISVWAFEKLADIKWGVIGIKYRIVPCDYKPANPARLPDGKLPSQGRQPPGGWDASKDTRPWSTPQWNPNPVSIPSGGGNSGSSSSSSNNNNNNNGQSSGGSGGGFDIIYNGLVNGWKSGGWNTQLWGPDSSWGIFGMRASCSNVEGGGATVLQGSSGQFSGKSTMEFWIKKNDAGVPDFTIELGGKKGSCRAFGLPGVQPVEWKSDWMRFVVYLESFNWESSGWQQSSRAFWKCSSSMSAGDVTDIRFKNNRGYRQSLCIDKMKVW